MSNVWPRKCIAVLCDMKWCHVTITSGLAGFRMSPGSLISNQAWRVCNLAWIVCNAALCHGRDVKLHTTVLNTRHRQRTQNNKDSQPASDNTSRQQHTQHQQQGQGHPQRTAFDGRWLLANYGDFDLGVQHVKQVHLSQRGQYSHDGYYKHIDNLLL